MDVFDLDRTLVEDYASFARSFTQIRASDIRDQVDAIYASQRFWPEPLITINPHLERGLSVEALVADGCPLLPGNRVPGGDKPNICSDFAANFIASPCAAAIWCANIFSSELRALIVSAVSTARSRAPVCASNSTATAGS